MITAILRAACGCEREVKAERATPYIEARMGPHGKMKQFILLEQVGPTVFIYDEDVRGNSGGTNPAPQRGDY